MALDETECDAAAADDDDCDEDEHSGVSEVAEAVAATLPPDSDDSGADEADTHSRRMAARRAETCLSSCRTSRWAQRADRSNSRISQYMDMCCRYCCCCCCCCCCC